MTHPLLPLLLAASEARFPPVDGGVTWLPAPRPDVVAAVAFTGHAVVCADLSPFADPAVDGYGSVHDPAVLLRLAASLPRPQVGVLDALLVGRGTGSGTGTGTGVALAATDRYDDHPRVRHARTIRDDVRVFGDERGLTTLAHGLAGRTELSVELTAAPPGTGRELIAATMRHVRAGDPVFAAVSPGNARSLRAFLALGFVPLGSEVIVHSRPDVVEH